MYSHFVHCFLLFDLIPLTLCVCVCQLGSDYIVHETRHNLQTRMFLDLPWDVLWRSFGYAPSPSWGQVNRQFRAHFAHKWVRTALTSALSPRCLRDQVHRWRGRIEILDITSANEEGLYALQHLADACPHLSRFSLSTRSSIRCCHATAMNRMLCGSHIMTHFALELLFPGSAPLPCVDGVDDGLISLFRVGVQHIAKNLQEFSLTLRGCELYDQAATRIVEVLPPEHMPQLRRLTLCLSHNNLDVCGARVLARWVASLPALCDVTIDMAHNRGLPGQLAPIFSVALQSLKLHALSVRWGSTQTPYGHRVPPFGFQHSTLQRVHLDIGFAFAEDVLALLLAIPSTIQCLSLRTNTHCFTSYPQHEVVYTTAILPVSVLGGAFKHYTRLRRLSLDLTGRCGPDTLRSLASDPTLVERLDGLRRVRLHVGRCHGRALVDVCSLLSRWGPTVTEWDIGMSGDSMTDQSATTLAMHLARCHGMQHLHLDVSHNRIGPRGWTSLVDAIRKMGGLRTLHFRCNHNPIGHAAPAAIFESVRVIHIELKDCNIRGVDHWIAHTIRCNLVAAAVKEWTLVLSDNDLKPYQCECMRRLGWTVVC